MNNVRFQLRFEGRNVAEANAKGWTGSCQPNVFDKLSREMWKELFGEHSKGKLLNENILNQWKERAYIRDHEYIESGAFTGKADYNLTLSGSQYGEFSIGMQILCGFTLFLFPSTFTHNYDIRYTLTDVKTGKKNRQYRGIKQILQTFVV